MNKLIKSKFFLGVMIVAVFAFVGAFSLQSVSAQTTTVVSPAFTYSGLMKIGSKGPGVSTLQAALNSVQSSPQIVVDGIFGPATRAAVIQFQASKGLVADGIVGPITGNALAQATIGVITVPGGLPAGCTSTAGYSPTTGVKCDSGSNLPAGCTSTAGYSPTTGIKCDSMMDDDNDNGSLQGGAGDIDLKARSTYSNEDVIEGEEDVKIMAFEVKADNGSDVEITSVKVEFVNSDGASSSDLDDYAESVSMWMGNKKVGESDADEFSENSDYWSDTIALKNAIVRAGRTETFVVAISALNNLDSGDIDTDDWEVDLLNVRFRDAMGVTTTETADAAGVANGTFSRDFDFESLASSGDLELKLALASSSPGAGSVEVDDTTTTDLTMLKFTLKAEGSDMTIDSIEMDAAATGVDNTWADMVSELSLEADGDELDSVSAYVGGVDDADGQILFNDLDFTIDEGDTVTFTVMAKIRAIAAGGGVGTAFDQGDAFTVSFTNANLDDTANTDVEDENGDTVPAGDRSGSAIGEAQAFYSSGVAVDMGNVTYESISDSGNVTQVTYTIPLMITSFGDTRYIGLSFEEEDDATVTDAIAGSYAFQLSTDPTTDIDEATTGNITTWACSASIQGGTAYRLDEGQTKNCTLTVTLTDGPTEPGSYRVHVEAIQTYTNAALNTGELIQLLTPVEDFQTAFRLLNS